MSKDSKDWMAEVTGYSPSTRQQGSVTVQTGHDTQRPDARSDIGKLFNRMNPPGVAGIAVAVTGGQP